MPGHRLPTPGSGALLDVAGWRSGLLLRFPCTQDSEGQPPPRGPSGLHRPSCVSEHGARWALGLVCLLLQGLDSSSSTPDSLGPCRAACGGQHVQGAGGDGTSGSPGLFYREVFETSQAWPWEG